VARSDIDPARGVRGTSGLRPGVGDGQMAAMGWIVGAWSREALENCAEARPAWLSGRMRETRRDAGNATEPPETEVTAANSRRPSCARPADRRRLVETVS